MYVITAVTCVDRKHLEFQKFYITYMVGFEGVRGPWKERCGTQLLYSNEILEHVFTTRRYFKVNNMFQD